MDEADFDASSPRELLVWCNQLRRQFRFTAAQLEDAAAMMQNILKTVEGSPWLLGIDVRRGARLTSEPIAEAANCLGVAANLAVIAHGRFLKHFGEAIERARTKPRKPEFDLEDS